MALWKTKGAGRKVGVKFLEVTSRMKGTDFFIWKMLCFPKRGKPEQRAFGLDKEKYKLSVWNTDFPASDMENAFSFFLVPD